MSKYRNPLIAAGVSLVVFLGLLLVLVLPRNSSISTANSNLVTAKQDTVTLNQEIATLTALASEAPQITAAENRFATLIPPTADEPGLIRYMQFITQKSGGTLTSVSFGTPATPAGASAAAVAPAPGTATTTPAYSTISLTINFTADAASASDPTLAYREIDNFIYQLTTLPRAAKVTAVSITGTFGTPYTAAITAEMYTTAPPTTAGG